MRWENVFPYMQLSFQSEFEISTFRGSRLTQPDSSEKPETINKLRLSYLESHQSTH
jgi:hypothetical protein